MSWLELKVYQYDAPYRSEPLPYSHRENVWLNLEQVKSISFQAERLNNNSIAAYLSCGEKEYVTLDAENIRVLRNYLVKSQER